ncbi:DUF2807 domain-containing protein [Caulobacter sp. S45]|jgi:hypothetical protein|uniref:DUF2807 domain-containing protein n=1 Tax=Caulobacter sp. S45 TaxID=1641861 RepID=UPI00131BAF2E|nr:DUF2807 domain-containing protein [Caulobacter sp. S45]
MSIRNLFCGVAVMAASASATAACHADEPPQVRIEHAAARLVVIAEPRNNVSVTVHHGDNRLPELNVRQEGGRVVVDGGLDAGMFGVSNDRTRCVGAYVVTHIGPMTHIRDNRAVFVRGVGRVDYDDLPVITAHVPLSARVAASSAVFGEVGRTDSLDLSAVGCGNWTVADVRGQLSVNNVGSGDIHAEAAGSLRGKLAGSGDLQTGAVGGDADVSIAGSGDVTTGAVNGALRAKVAGSGDVAVASIAGPVDAGIAASGGIRIHGGHAPNVKARVAGSGDFSFDGEAGSLSAAVVGSGDIYVAHVSGPVSKSVMGSGDVRTGR